MYVNVNQFFRLFMEFWSHFVIGHPSRSCFQVLQLKDDIDTSLVQEGAATVASSDHEVRLTEVVRVAVRKQQEIQELQANVSGFLLCSAKVFFGMFGGTSFWDLCKDKCWNFNV